MEFNLKIHREINIKLLFHKYSQRKISQYILLFRWSRTIIYQDFTENGQKYSTHTIKFWRKNIAAIKPLAEEIVDSENGPAIIETVINEGTQFVITAKVKLNSINKTFPSETKVNEQGQASNETVKLPNLETSKFHGDPTSWQEFIESFTAAVQNQLSNVEKINYWRSFLAGDAQHEKSSLSLTNDNYHEALNLFKESIWKQTDYYIYTYEWSSKVSKGIRRRCQVITKILW